MADRRVCTGGSMALAGVAHGAGPGPALVRSLSCLWSTRNRPLRVTVLTIAIAAMSLADLAITLTYVRSVGMGEGNPIARYVIDHGSPWLLGAWKCASVGLACLIFLRHRGRRSTEMACWFAVGVLVWLLVQWSAYSDEAWRLTPALHMMSDGDSALWVRMAGPDR